MRHIFLIALAIVTLNVTAQEQKPQQRKGDKKERPQRMQKFADFTPEEIAEIRTKKMTLEFDLTEAQQKDMYKLNLKNSIERTQMMQERKERIEKRKNNKAQGEEGMQKPSKEERFNMINSRLDKQIEHKKQMKSILNKEQFEKWERVSKKMEAKNKDRWNKKPNKKGNRNSSNQFKKRN